jgi:hypothetical protein
VEASVNLAHATCFNTVRAIALITPLAYLKAVLADRFSAIAKINPVKFDESLAEVALFWPAYIKWQFVLDGDSLLYFA